MIVCYSSKMVGYEKRLGDFFNRLLFSFAAIIGASTFFYKEKMFNYLNCMGKDENFMFNLRDPFETSSTYFRFRLNYWHPFRVANTLTVLLFIVTIPVFYYKIYVFRKEQNASVPGIIFQFYPGMDSFKKYA